VPVPVPVSLSTLHSRTADIRVCLYERRCDFSTFRRNLFAYSKLSHSEAAVSTFLRSARQVALQYEAQIRKRPFGEHVCVLARACASVCVRACVSATQTRVFNGWPLKASYYFM
jgi:hypothetical protein